MAADRSVTACSPRRARPAVEADPGGGTTLGPPARPAPGVRARRSGHPTTMDGVAAIRVRDVREVDDALHAALLVCWTDVVNAGGAVGFVAPVTREDVAPRLDTTLVAVRQGRDALCLLEVDGEPAGFAFLVAN